MPFTAICCACGQIKDATNAIDDGWRLLATFGKYTGELVNAFCWRCDRERRAAAMTNDLSSLVVPPPAQEPAE